MEEDRESCAVSEGQSNGLCSEVDSERVEKGLGEEVGEREEEIGLGLGGDGVVLATEEEDLLHVEPEERDWD